MIKEILQYLLPDAEITCNPKEDIEETRIFINNTEIISRINKTQFNKYLEALIKSGSMDEENQLTITQREEK